MYLSVIYIRFNEHIESLIKIKIGNNEFYLKFTRKLYIDILGLNKLLTTNQGRR